MPKLTIITATLNSAIHLQNCIDSLRAQTFRDYEHIIVDGKSTDNTREIVSRYMTSDDRVKMYQQIPQGVYAALNYGIEKSNGEYILILHSDDFLFSKQVLEKYVLLIERTGSKFVYSDLVYLSPKKNSVRRHWCSGDYNTVLLKYGWMPPHPTCVISKEIYDVLGGYSRDYVISSDYEFCLRVLTSDYLLPHTVSYLDEVTYGMRLGGISNTRHFLKFVEDYKIAAKYFNLPLFVIIFKIMRKVKQLRIKTEKINYDTISNNKKT